MPYVLQLLQFIRVGFSHCGARNLQCICSSDNDVIRSLQRQKRDAAAAADVASELQRRRSAAFKRRAVQEARRLSAQLRARITADAVLSPCQHCRHDDSIWSNPAGRSDCSRGCSSRTCSRSCSSSEQGSVTPVPMPTTPLNIVFQVRICQQMHISIIAQRKRIS